MPSNYSITFYTEMVVVISAAIFAEKSGIEKSEDRDSHDQPITRDRNDRKCHLMYKH